MGKGEEKVEVMDNFKAGVTDLKFVTLKRSKGAPYTITIGKLKDVIVEGYDKRPAIDENFIELEVNPNGKDFKLFSIIFKNGDFPQSNMGYRNYESIGKKAYFNFSIDEKDELIDMLNQMYDESGDEDIMNWIDDIESYKSEESEEDLYEGYGESEVDRYSSYNQDINERLKAYAEENGEDYSEMKYEFMKLADRHNMKYPKEAKDAYFKIVNDFLSEEGY